MQVADSLRLCAPPFTKLVGRLRLFAPHRKIADSLRLLALFVHSTHEIFGTSQAFCNPMMKLPYSLRLCAPPFKKNGGRLRLCAAP